MTAANCPRGAAFGPSCIVLCSLLQGKGFVLSSDRRNARTPNQVLLMWGLQHKIPGWLTLTLYKSSRWNGRAAQPTKRIDLSEPSTSRLRLLQKFCCFRNESYEQRNPSSRFVHGIIYHHNHTDNQKEKEKTKKSPRRALFFKSCSSMSFSGRYAKLGYRRFLNKRFGLNPRFIVRRWRHRFRFP